MIDRICISLNNRCNLACRYCHFHEKAASIRCREMDVFAILDNVMAYARHPFKIGFVGNGEPLLDLPLLKDCLTYIEGDPFIHTYTITNGTIPLTDDDIRFLEDHRVNVGFSLDGHQELHDRWRCGSFATVMANIAQYRSVTGHDPTLNVTVGEETIRNAGRVIDFFSIFRTRITFSRMIGRYGISLEDYRSFLELASKRLSVRQGALDCTMYGGMCGAGRNNYYFANGYVYLCGNCVDLSPVGKSSMPIGELEKIGPDFDRTHCYKEAICA